MKNTFLNFLCHRTCFTVLFLTGIVLLYACEQPSKPKSEFYSQQKSDNIRHAVGFDLITEDGYQILHIFRHYNDTKDTLSYLLVSKGAEVPSTFKGLKRIQVPVKRIGLLHSSYLSFFDFCEAKDKIKAISEVKYVYDDSLYQAVQQGDMKEVGYGEALDKEQLLALDIQLVVTVGWPNSPNKSEQSLDDLGIPMLIFSDWQETTLLGRAEWVKVIAALTGKDSLVNDKFTKIEQAYLDYKSLTDNLLQRPEIICNLPYKGAWYVPGGNSYVSNLIQDAGGNYIWRGDSGTGGLQLDFETVYVEGIKADFWLNPGFTQTLEDILDKDERLKDFQTIKSGNIYNSTNRIAREQANDYWESGIVNPHIILADLVHILHPELLPDHQLVYYKQIF